MKRVLLPLLLFVFFQIASSRHKEYPTYFDLYFSVGYGNTVSSDVSDYYQSIIDSYRSLGIPIQTQTKFGPTAIGNIGFDFSKLKEISFGVCLGYSYSPAFSNYQDYSGTMKINGSVNSFDALLNVRFIPIYIDTYPCIINARVGCVYSSLKITKEIRFNNFSESNINWDMTTNGFGPEMEATIGTSKEIGSIYIAIEGGYKVSLVKIEQYNEELNGVSNQNNKSMNIGPRGGFVQVSFGINL
jgi:hypothetical protein